MNWIRRHPWLTAIAGCLAIGILVYAVIFTVAADSDYPTSTAPPRPIVASPSPTEDPDAAEERARAQQWVAEKLPAYACQGRTEQAHFTNWSDVVFCPDYTATIELKGSKASDVPVITYPADGIVVKATHYREQFTPETSNTPVWKEGWRFTITYAPGVIPAGWNLKYNFVIGGIESPWTGPQAYGERLDTETYAPDTMIVEIYGASPNLEVMGLPIPAEKDPHRT